MQSKGCSQPRRNVSDIDYCEQFYICPITQVSLSLKILELCNSCLKKPTCTASSTSSSRSAISTPTYTLYCLSMAPQQPLVSWTTFLSDKSHHVTHAFLSSWLARLWFLTFTCLVLMLCWQLTSTLAIEQHSFHSLFTFCTCAIQPVHSIAQGNWQTLPICDAIQQWHQIFDVNHALLCRKSWRTLS